MSRLRIVLLFTLGLTRPGIAQTASTVSRSCDADLVGAPSGPGVDARLTGRWYRPPIPAASQPAPALRERGRCNAVRQR